MFVLDVSHHFLISSLGVRRQTTWKRVNFPSMEGNINTHPGRQTDRRGSHPKPSPILSSQAPNSQTLNSLSLLTLHPTFPS